MLLDLCRYFFNNSRSVKNVSFLQIASNLVENSLTIWQSFTLVWGSLPSWPKPTLTIAGIELKVSMARFLLKPAKAKNGLDTSDSFSKLQIHSPKPTQGALLGSRFTHDGLVMNSLEITCDLEINTLSRRRFFEVSFKIMSSRNHGHKKSHLNIFLLQSHSYLENFF